MDEGTSSRNLNKLKKTLSNRKESSRQDRNMDICCMHRFSYITLTLILVMNSPEVSCTRRNPARRDRFSCAGKLPTRYFPGPRSGDNGFRVKIEGEPEHYEALREYTVTLQSTHPGSFRGFALRATNYDGQPAGSFNAINQYTSQVMTSCNHVVTHSISGKKSRIQVRWRAPTDGCVRISASVIQKGLIWFKDAHRLTLNICQQNLTTVFEDPNPCCACGSATYRMTFYGLWSPQTHPKDYPTYSTHWSNIIGASHSNNYVVWEYGGYATEGVQKVAEWGWPANLEGEIRSHGDDIMSVITTRAQWPAYEPRNIREPPSDRFDVDSRRHLVSLVTMLGPSPDWNVGLSKESMCTEACGWAGSRTYNLVPWDAGTDDGVTYMSPNSPTNPHEKIRTLTSSDHPHSPFFNPDGGAIPPVARVVITRISIAGEQCGESEVINEADDALVTSLNVQASENPTCMYSEWSDWSECEVTCGWGIKTRSRLVKLRQDSAACESTMEKEICQGSGQCANDSDVTVCLYSEWASWSPCAASCGTSLRVRSRVLKWPSEASNCHEPLKEMSDCELPVCACAYSQWSDWMSCAVTCGIGQTVRKRIVQSESGDCTGPLMQISQCMTSMFCDEDSDVTPGCTYSAWSDWSPCPVTCGVGQTFRKRVLQPSIGASPCQGFQMQNSKCMTSSGCEETCSYGDWSEWMSCSVTCGVGATLRKRFLTGSNHDGLCEGLIMENAPCHNPPCDVQSRSQCTFMTWTPWMPCSVSCGKGETLRKRFLNRTSGSDHCDDFEMETNRCMVSCDVTVTPPECDYSDWSPWMPCSADCETFRKRLLHNQPAHLSCDPVVMETKRCTSSECSEATPPRHREDVECSTSPWQQWGDCSVTCGRGHETRMRQLLPHAISDTSSVDCSAKILIQRRRCRTSARCPRDCVMTSWRAWSSCDVICAEGRRGHQTRRRGVISRARFGGTPCQSRRQKRTCRCT